jgi:hypothetical protein
VIPVGGGGKRIGGVEIGLDENCSGRGDGAADTAQKLNGEADALPAAAAPGDGDETPPPLHQPGPAGPGSEDLGKFLIALLEGAVGARIFLIQEFPELPGTDLNGGVQGYLHSEKSSDSERETGLLGRRARA